MRVYQVFPMDAAARASLPRRPTMTCMRRHKSIARPHSFTDHDPQHAAKEHNVQDWELLVF